MWACAWRMSSSVCLRKQEKKSNFFLSLLSSTVGSIRVDYVNVSSERNRRHPTISTVYTNFELAYTEKMSHQEPISSPFISEGPLGTQKRVKKKFSKKAKEFVMSLREWYPPICGWLVAVKQGTSGRWWSWWERHGISSQMLKKEEKWLVFSRRFLILAWLWNGWHWHQRTDGRGNDDENQGGN